MFWVQWPFETVFQSVLGRLPKGRRKRRERIDENKNVQTTLTRTYCKCSRPLPYCKLIVGQGTFMVAVGADSGCLDIVSLAALWILVLSVPGRLTNLDDSRARTYCACSDCGSGLFGDIFFRQSFLLFFLPVSERRSDRQKYSLKGPLNPNHQPASQPISCLLYLVSVFFSLDSFSLWDTVCNTV